MKASDYIVKFLADKGIDNIFVLYGAASGPLIDAFTRVNGTSYVAVMHEQAAGFAAEIYAKVKGVPGAAIVTSGPGAQNVITSIANCFYDSVPCIFLSGQINSNFLNEDPEIRQIGFQECDIVGITKPITKYSKLVKDPQAIRYEMEKAFHICNSGRPGPVLLDIPVNLQGTDIDPDELVGYNAAVDAFVPDMDAVDASIESFIKDLRGATRPALLVGGGARLSGSVDLVREIASLANIPCFPTWNGLDAITNDFEMYGGRIGTYGGAGRNFGIQNADLLLAVGSRIPGRITGGNVSTFAREATKYLVDIDAGLVQPHLQQVPFDHSIHCDAHVFCIRLLERLKAEQAKTALPDFGPWVSTVMQWKDKYDPVKEALSADPEHRVDGTKYTHPYTFLQELSRQMDSDAIIIGDHGGVSVVIAHALHTKTGQRYLTSNGNAPLGFSFAAAMGAWFAAPDRQVVAIIGDGGFNMNIQELQTFINYGVNVKTIILNNHIYGITKAYQLTNFQGRTEACGPEGYNPPDFMAVTEAYGMKAVSINSDDEIADGLAEVLGHNGPVVCDVNMHNFHVYQPRIFGWATPIEDMYPYVPRDEFKANMFIEPHESWLDPVYPDVEKEGGAME